MNENEKRKKELLYRWIRLSQEGVTIAKLLKDRNARDIALYGYTELARLILYELKNSNEIKIRYIIDKRSGGLQISFSQKQPTDSSICDVDMILITLVDTKDIQEVRENIMVDSNCQIVTIEEVLYGL